MFPVQLQIYSANIQIYTTPPLLVWEAALARMQPAALLGESCRCLVAETQAAEALLWSVLLCQQVQASQLRVGEAVGECSALPRSLVLSLRIQRGDTSSAGSRPSPLA